MEPPDFTALDDFVAAFEKARREGHPARIEEFLPPPDHPLRLTVLGELVRVEMELDWRDGHPRSLADYLHDFPVLAHDLALLGEIAYEEYRQRLLAGQRPTPEAYADRFRVDVRGWYVPGASPPPKPLFLQVPRSGSKVGHSSEELPALLRRRLTFVGLFCATGFAYFAVLVLLNPASKVGFSLEFGTSVTLTALTLLACVLLTTLLWSARPLTLANLRAIETALFGMVLSYLGLSLFSDLFLDHELHEPLAEGDHALFHYGSSWSLPFFALGVAYGVLIPSTFRRCAVVVGAMAAVPVGLGAAAGVVEGMFTASFVQSFLLQMALWMACAWATAVYGSHRLETLRRETSAARQLGQYRLRRRLGSGGMGEVYLGEHVLLRRPCAIKVIRAELAADAISLKRFEREVQVMATLRHPNTVQIYDYGHSEDGRFYYVMEYLPGHNLEEVVERDGPMQPKRAVHLLLQVAGALRESHAVGLVHRDVKPGNIMTVEQSGLSDVAKLLDFGLVQVGEAGDEGGRLTGQEVVAGTPAYVSPEQAGGKKDLDARTDVYSLGAVAYFLLTGRPPFERETGMQMLMAHVHEPVVHPSQHRAGIPAALEAIVLRCLEKDPARRYPDAGALEEALREWES